MWISLRKTKEFPEVVNLRNNMAEKYDISREKNLKIGRI
jgi:hypothetical protein